MIMVHKPVHVLSSPSTYHRRHPSAPPSVLVQPTRIPGLLSLSKSQAVAAPRSQQPHQNQHGRQSRASQHKPKPTNTARPLQPQQISAAAQPQLSEDLSKLTTPARLATKSNSQSVVVKSNNRRNHSHHHQGSPPTLSNLPSQAEVTNKPNSLPLTHSLHTRQHNSFDPFLVSSESESDNPPPTPTKANLPVRSAPKITSRPTGKLARRRQNISDAPSTPTLSKAMSVPRPRGQLPSLGSHPLNISRSVPSLSSIQSSDMARDVFPICDDLTDVEDDDVFAPSTPVRSKGGSVTWQRSPAYDDGPRTAPLSTPHSSFPFNTKSTSTPTPERKRQHARFPSEGVFNLSMDEDSSNLSDASVELKAKADFPPRRRIASAASTPMGSKRDFWASSKFQNSPSPDVLPIPAFKAQAALQ
ncbi:hypothetical protein BJV74DRAFT_768855 [Russula compacta]|nr:hypothetical protein BJV74DRAFT_768855 [Russula compacta]